MDRRNPNFNHWDGPTFKEGRDVPCQSCDATGVCEDGEQLDVDDFRDCLCDHCKGTGEEPWRAAGDRYTGAPDCDAITICGGLIDARAALLAARGTWREAYAYANYLHARSKALGKIGYGLHEAKVEHIRARLARQESARRMLSQFNQTIGRINEINAQLRGEAA